MVGLGIGRRARRALDRQLQYQRQKALALKGHEDVLMAQMAVRSAEVRDKLARVKPLRPDVRALEVGSGAHGLIFFFDAGERVGVDPLADQYATLFPVWQGLAKTIAAFGESLPFADASFDVVLCDNVVDHAENPRRIVEEIVRVLAPDGLLYFTVNVHHPFYHWTATVHAAWRAAGIPFEITPFADHTVHLTIGAARRLFAGLPLRVVAESDDIDEARRQRPRRIRHMGDRLKHLFFKNAQYELIAERQASA